jgi:hypothetical protein
MYWDIFNAKADELFKDLIAQFPNVPEFKNFRSLLVMFSNIEPKKPEFMFRTFFLSKYRKSLLEKDESFFLDKSDYETEPGQDAFWDSFIKQLKSLWKSLDNQNKEVMWKYFHVLVVLSDKCHADK